MHGNACPHATIIVDEFLHDVGLNRMTWPARNPDINPIELVWLLKAVLLLHPCEEVAMRLFRSRRHSEPPAAPGPLESNAKDCVEYQTVKAVPAVVLEEASSKEMKKRGGPEIDSSFPGNPTTQLGAPRDGGEKLTANVQSPREVGGGRRRERKRGKAPKTGGPPAGPGKPGTPEEDVTDLAKKQEKGGRCGGSGGHHPPPADFGEN
ncbi:hypothetical protein ANN_09713 [Periplaneta americana]|uniref:Tc1-like transposase DDE domain-containing protein n=1 Tax=Periplaneta americana TaxID=6978 RepID=A0ABQ8TQP5_PERAM|nr:hypothetical protein ANN_09713 [Periplaneta americana]